MKNVKKTASYIRDSGSENLRIWKRKLHVSSLSCSKSMKGLKRIWKNFIAHWILLSVRGEGWKVVWTVISTWPMILWHLFCIFSCFAQLRRFKLTYRGELYPCLTRDAISRWSHGVHEIFKTPSWVESPTGSSIAVPFPSFAHYRIYRIVHVLVHVGSPWDLYLEMSL